MRFLVSTDVAAFKEIDDNSGHIYFCEPGQSLVVPLTTTGSILVWICNGKEVTRELINLWSSQNQHAPKVMLVKDSSAVSLLEGYSQGRIAKIVALPSQFHHKLPWAESVLRIAERLHVHTRAEHETRPDAVKSRIVDSTVLLVGAGIMNLLTGHFLAARGYQVRIIDAGPDPRTCQDWTRLGVTNGGGNARMFTRTEADNYNEKGSRIYQDMRPIFRKTVREGGWSVKSPECYTDAEQAWVAAFEQLPPWLARAFREDIHEVNREAGVLWNEMMKTSPQLFQDVGLHQGILRLYVESTALEAARQLNRELGTMTHETSHADFIERHPFLLPAFESDRLAGGFYIDGFTVNIHPFVAKLMDEIIRLGGTFTWDCQVQGISRNVFGEATTLQSSLGPLEAEHYVISPGTAGYELLRGTSSGELIQGVLGVWLQIPNVDLAVQHSIKIHRRGHMVEDINVTVTKDAETGDDILVLGGGYGYVGTSRPSPDCPELSTLFGELEEVAKIYFPRGHAIAKARGTLWPGGNYKFCVRPFTATGLGIFEKIPTANGGSLIITGGNNTGGFTQAPAIARSVWRALVGTFDPIHAIFHPDRGRLPSACAAPALRRQEDSPSPFRLLLLCSDGPQHSYLRYRLEEAFPGFRCIVETNKGQMRHLMDKGRYMDVAYMQYHDLRRYMFGYDRQRKAYFDRLINPEYVPRSPDMEVDSLNCTKVWDAVEKWQPDVTIVSGTKYIGKRLNERAGMMINLHIGHLPEYKGNHCIFFALYDEAIDKVAATLHQLTPQLDGGRVLDTVFPPILSQDNEETLYTRCLHMAIDRSLEHVKHLSGGMSPVLLPQKSEGKMFRHCDRTPTKEIWLWWKLNIQGFLRKCPPA
ncbi:FAD dependent oxidoreductase-like protein 5 [Elsinoe australis]|uniref:FAD dependent oxidoreductase-like protein 5 n=1 Tax=Elsinoe australis TaxID=40998 RepID=A0A4U7APB3_9PEZI|nr:FAD dependent oxidoreductase-like protein 5 [Elsinoe australis]